MNRGLYIGKSGMLSFQEKMDTIGNNIANSQTAGYKKLTASFQELLRDEIGMLGTPLTTAIEAKNPTLGTGVKISDPYRIYTQGVLLESGNPIECAIDGEGYFGYTDVNGELKLSRSANLSINIDTGQLVDEQGNVLQVQNGINFLEYGVKGITINTDGTLVAESGNGEYIDAGRIIMYYVPNKEVLQDRGRGYFSVTNPAGAVASTNAAAPQNLYGNIRQGRYEGSNVDLGSEMVDLMVTQRGYQLSLKSVQTADEMWGQANSVLKR